MLLEAWDRLLQKVHGGLDHFIWSNIVHRVSGLQSIFRHTQDHIVQHGSTAEVLSYRQAAQTVAGVVEVPRLARFIQKPPSGALAAHKNVLLQGLLVKHPVAHAEGRVTLSV